MGHHADAWFSSVGCARLCNEPQCLNNTPREESFHSLIEKVQNEKKQSNQLVSAAASRCQFRSWEWRKMYISGWQHMSSATADTISPYLVSWFRHTSFHFPWCFVVLLQACTTRHGELPVLEEQLCWPGQVPPARVVCPAVKATFVTTASHLAPERCKPPLLFYYFPPFIDDQAWRIFFFQLFRFRGCLLHFLKKTASLKTTITQKPQNKTNR